MLKIVASKTWKESDSQSAHLMKDPGELSNLRYLYYTRIEVSSGHLNVTGNAAGGRRCCKLLEEYWKRMDRQQLAHAELSKTWEAWTMFHSKREMDISVKCSKHTEGKGFIEPENIFDN